MSEKNQMTKFLILREGRGGLAVFGDDDDFYRPVFFFNPPPEQKEIEEIKSKFLVNLLENYGYQQEDVSLDVSFGAGMIDCAGLVVWQKGVPFIMADFLARGAGTEQAKKAKKTLFDKARTFGASFAVLVQGAGTEAFAIKGKEIRSCAIPKNPRLKP
ncbi:MAG: hypothetical protein M1127_00285 [Patescibacteria group bacterium]|nr:hypothetical protein [Patescibacteria group bacterium]